ncbi:hypothetical protein [Clostridium sp.]|uniref:hypothetical protein n=1 Tax=Clostridium sp. TaxID=1506 RepID=UPI00399359B9
MNNNIDLYSDSELNKLFENLKSNNNKSNNENIKDKLVLFVSFDLVDFTKFKMYNSSIWLKVIYDITNTIQKKVTQIDFHFQLWRSIGDEVVFAIEISQRKVLEDLVQKIFCLLNEINKNIKNCTIFSNMTEDEKRNIVQQNILSVKATAWIARVSNISLGNNQNEKDGQLMYNIQYDINLLNDNYKMIEFQGIDIDSGFRVAKNCTKSNRLALSIELAYILSLNKCIENKINLIKFISLKGVWDGKLYPVLWYHDQYIVGLELEKSFSYDEEIDDVDFKSLIEMNKKYKEIRINDFLNKIINDRCLNEKINFIIELLKDNNEFGSKKPIKVFGNSNIEIHCVAVCINSEGKFLMGKRRISSDDKFSNQWDFGCSRMTHNFTFKETLIQDYKKTFNVDIEVLEPFADYNFDKNGVKVPGIRYKAKIKECSNIYNSSEKYSQIAFISLEDFEKMNKTDFIDYDDFKRIMNLLKEDANLNNKELVLNE